MPVTYHDYQGVWPDIGEPPYEPIPRVCPRTFTVFDEHTRYLGHDERGWFFPDSPPQPPPPPEGESPFTLDHKAWASCFPTHPLALWVAYGVAKEGDRRFNDLDREISMLGKAWDFQISGRYTIEGVTCTEVAYLGVGEYGERYRCDFSTDRCDYVWWTGANCFMTPGWTGSVRATHVAHTVFGGVKKNTVARCANPAAPRKRKAGADDES